jgi:biopolymer transport protein ExbD
MNKLQLVAAMVLISVSTSPVIAQGAGSRLPAGVDQKTDQAARNYVTVNAAGQVVVLDRATGLSRSLTAVEAQRLAQGLSQLINQSTEGLVQVQRADGSVSMDLEGRFQNVVVAKREDDGSITQGCVDNIQAAAAFFEIDESLFDASKSATSQSPSNPLDVR